MRPPPKRLAGPRPGTALARPAPALAPLALSTAPPPTGQDAGQGAGKAGDDLLQVRLQALYRSGLVSDIAEVLGKGGSADPTTRLWRARVDIYLGAPRQGLPGPGRAGRAAAPAAAQGREAAAAGLLRRRCRQCGRRRAVRPAWRGRRAARPISRLRPLPVSRAASASARLCPSACRCSTTASWSCWARSTPPRSSRRPSRRCWSPLPNPAPSTRRCKSPRPRPRCASTR